MKPERRDVTTREAALLYASIGWFVFPVHSVVRGRCSCGKLACGRAGKHPRTRNGLKDATNDADQIARWWQEWPEANVAVATGASRLVVLDVDVRKEKDGQASLRALESEFGPLPDTLVSRTGGGGWHHFFRAPHPPVGDRVGIRPGLDLKAGGGYVILPPSTHPSGGGYEFEESPSFDDLADTPGWLVQIGKKSNNGKRRGQRTKPLGTASTSGRIPEFERNATLTSMAGTMMAVGFDLPAIRNALLMTNRSQCDPPLEESEVDGIARSIAENYAAGVPRAGGIFWPRDIEKRLKYRPHEQRLFKHLVTNANWKPKNGLGAGEIRVSTRDLGEACAVDHNNKLTPLSSSTVAAGLGNLVTWGLIEVLGTHPGTHLRIVNYEQYRGIPVGRVSSSEQGSEQP